MVIIAGDFGFPDGGAPAARVRNLAMGFLAAGEKVHIIAMSDTGVSDQNGCPEWFGEGLSIERPPAQFVRTKSENRSLRDRMIWMAKVYRGSWAIARRFRSGCVGGAGDICILYGRSYFRLRPLAQAAREKKITVLLDVVEGIERFGGFGGALNPIFWDWGLGSRYLPLLADGVTAISHGLVQRCRDLGVRNVLLVPGVESWSEDSPPTLMLRRACARFRLVHVGALSRKDAPAELVEFVRLVRLKELPLNIDLCGRYEQSSEGRHWLAELKKIDCGSSPVVRLLGSISSEDLENAFKQADGFLLFRADTVAERISFPTRLVEYLKQARPVFISGVGDIPSYLEDGRDAVLLPVGDAETALGKVSDFIDNPERLRAIGLAGWIQGRKSFDRNRHAIKILVWARQLTKE